MRWIPNFGDSLRGIPARRLLGTAILSASALLLEIALTRLFSLLYYPPYVFFIISIAILGIGIGAAAVALRPKLALDTRLAVFCAGATLCTLLLLLFATVGSVLDLPILLFILLVLPYVCFGMAISSLFAQHASASRILYMSDLIGAGCGALLTIPLLNRFGAVNAVLLAALGFSIAGFYFASRRHRLIVTLAFAASGLAFTANAVTDFLDVDPAKLSSEKPIVSVLTDGGRILQSRWDAFARTDLVDPGTGGPLRIYVDGGAASIMPTDAARRDLLGDIGFFPFATDQPEHVFIIGPGAGLDVWFGLQSKAQRITAVEVNAASVEIVNDRPGYTGGLYDRAEVGVVVDDGRSALRRSAGKYDLIFLSQVVTLAAERGGYALSENAIYTQEAFADYLAHLSEDGQIALKLYDEITLTRAVSTALSALRQQGLDDKQALKHLMAFIDNRSNPPVPLLLIGADAYSQDDSLVLGAIARDVGFTPVLLPHVLVQSPLDTVDSGTESFASIIAASEVDISPPTDDRPYFFQFERGIPASLVPLAWVALIVTGALILTFVLQWRRASATVDRWYPAFFAMLGIGFIMVEIFAIQQTRLFLGHPTIAVTLVLVTFLVGGGMGSGLSQYFFHSKIAHRPQIATAFIVAFLIAWSLLWNLISRELVAADATMRALIVVMSLLPLALCMGVPFPLALEKVGRSEQRQIATAWAVNGLMTVVGSVVAVVLSITVGFSLVMWFGASAYLLATLILWLIQRSEAA